MVTRSNVSVARIGRYLAAVTAVAAPLSLVLAAGQAAANPDPVKATSGPISEAEQLLKAGRAVEARAALQKALEPGTTLSGSEASRALQLLGEANRAIQSTDPLDVSLQKARLALVEGDLRTAEHHARAVSKSATANPRQSAEAWKVLDATADRRRELAEVVPGALAQAEKDFLAGRYAESKAGLGMVFRSGVELTPEQEQTLTKYQTRIVDLERARGEAFATPGSMGLMQPGVVRRREPGQPEQPPAQPPEQPPAQQPPVEAPAAQPEQPAAQPPAQPAAQPPAPTPAPAPAPQPAGDDLIQQAMRFEAQSLLAQAEQAFQEARLNEAQSKFIQVRNQYRQHLTAAQVQQVERRLEEIRVRIGQGGNILGELQQDLELVRQRTLATFNHELEEARRALDTGDPSRARDLVARARLTLNTGRDAFAESDFENLRRRVDGLLTEIGQKEQEILRRQTEQRDRELREQAQRTAEQQQRERERKINELLDRARAYQQELRYREALQAIEQLLFLDPINPAGLLLRDLYRDNELFMRYNDMQDRKNYLFGVNSLDNQSAAVPPAGIMNYPTDWPQISVRRGEPLAFADSEDNRRVLAELDNRSRRIPSVRFSDNSLEDVVRFVGDYTQLNIDVDWTSLENVGVRRESTVSLSLSNVTPKTLLDRVVAKVGEGTMGGADWAVYDGIVTIASEEAIRKNTVLVIYDIRDLLHEIPDYDEVPQLDLQSVLQSSQGGSGGGRSPFSDTPDRNSTEKRARQEQIDQIVSIITENVDFEGWVDNGGSTGKIQRLANQGQLIITNTAKNHRQVAGLLSKLREVRAMQINVETRFLLVNQDFFEQIGFDLDVYINANNNQVRAARANAPTFQPSDMFGDGRINRSSTSPGLGPVTGGTPGSVTQGFVNPRNWSPIGFQQDHLGLSSRLAPSQGIAADILGGAPALGIAGQFLDDIQVDFLVQATQADRRSVQLTAPRLTFTNGQVANIFVATQQSYVSDLASVVADSAVGFDPTIAVVSEGVTMVVEGTVTADRRYVTMNIDAGVSRIDGFANQAVSAVAGGQLVSSATTQSFIQLPTVTVTRVRTSVTVPDQGTLLLGGQRLVTEFDVETGVPVLSKIPILNRFFTNRIESKEEQTLLILVKPTILIQNEEEERAFPGLLGQMGGFGG